MSLRCTFWKCALFLCFRWLNLSLYSLGSYSIWLCLPVLDTLSSTVFFRLFIVFYSWLLLLCHVDNPCVIALCSLPLIHKSCTFSLFLESRIVLNTSTHDCKQVCDSITTQLLSNLPWAYRFSVCKVKINQFDELLLLVHRENLAEDHQHVLTHK